MSKIKLTEAFYDKATGISYAEISTDYGTFSGYAYLNPEDKDIESSFAGCNYAERRAVIQYYKHRLRIINYKIQTLEEINARLENSDNCSINSNEFQLLQKIMKEYYQQEHDIKRNIEIINFALEEDIKNRPFLVAELRSKAIEKETK